MSFSLTLAVTSLTFKVGSDGGEVMLLSLAVSVGQEAHGVQVLM